MRGCGDNICHSLFYIIIEEKITITWQHTRRYIRDKAPNCKVRIAIGGGNNFVTLLLR